jgi:cation diffusion facilitator family transporter
LEIRISCFVFRIFVDWKEKPILMHISELDSLKHGHRFHTAAEGTSERRTYVVIALTASMMVIEIVAGKLFGSMALLADGWHMGTHAAALSITAFAYTYARRHANDPVYTFGTGKVGVLGGFASALVLAVIALLMAWESGKRLIHPVEIRFDEALLVAFVGLIVNLLSAYLLMHRPGSRHLRNGEGFSAHRHDHNLRAAYLHVLADALTSLLAIVALLFVRSFGWVRMDPLMGMAGAAIIGRWSYGLLRDTGKILLDAEAHTETIAAIRSTLEAESDNRISDLHLWRVGPHDFAAIVTVSTHDPKPPEHYKALLSGFDALSHITVEVHAYPGPTCLPPGEEGRDE